MIYENGIHRVTKQQFPHETVSYEDTNIQSVESHPSNVIDPSVSVYLQSASSVNFSWCLNEPHHK